MDELVRGIMTDAEMIRFASEQGFDVVVTIDRGIKHEQSVSSLPVPVIELSTEGGGSTMNDFTNYCYLTPYLKDALSMAAEHRFVRVSPKGIEIHDNANGALRVFREATLSEQRAFWELRQVNEPDHGHGY